MMSSRRFPKRLAVSSSDGIPYIESFGSGGRSRMLSYGESRLLMTDEVITIARSANLGFTGLARANVA